MSADVMLSRRRFVAGTVVGGIGTLVAAGLVGAYKMLTPPDDLSRSARVTVPHEYLPAVGAAPIKIPEGAFFVLQDPEGIYAFSWACTHMGAELKWYEEPRPRFECPSHGAQFTRDGERFAGPAPRPMDLYPALFNSRGDLVVDTSRISMQNTACDSPELLERCATLNVLGQVTGFRHSIS